MNSVIFGTGEYVTGWTGKEGSKSDKSLGVVALVHFDLRERGLIGDKIALCGTNGAKFEDIRKHFEEKINFSNLKNLSFDQFPQVPLAGISQFTLLILLCVLFRVAELTGKLTWRLWKHSPSQEMSAPSSLLTTLTSRSSWQPWREASM